MVASAHFAHSPLVIWRYEAARLALRIRVTVRFSVTLYRVVCVLVLLATQKVEGSSPFSRFFPLVQAVSGGFEWERTSARSALC